MRFIKHKLAQFAGYAKCLWPQENLSEFRMKARYLARLRLEPGKWRQYMGAIDILRSEAPTIHLAIQLPMRRTRYSGDIDPNPPAALTPLGVHIQRLRGPRQTL